MESWPDFLPAFVEADNLDRAFLMLNNYYSQSTGKRAAALIQKIRTIYSGGRPNILSQQLASDPIENPALTAMRRNYYFSVLRPLLVDATFIAELQAVKLRIQDAYYTLQQRDEAIIILQGSVSYWDSIYQ